MLFHDQVQQLPRSGEVCSAGLSQPRRGKDQRADLPLHATAMLCFRRTEPQSNLSSPLAARGSLLSSLPPSSGLVFGGVPAEQREPAAALGRLLSSSPCRP